MKFSTDDTIAAIASPTGAAERGIVRISGSNVLNVLTQVFHPDDSSVVLNRIRKPERIPGRIHLNGMETPLPVGVWLWPTDRSYTGQPMAELHTIGSPPLLDAVLELLWAHGVRAANRGEFTLRAFLAGRIDLMQAEAVLGVIDAADHEELQTALTQLGGATTGRLTSVRSELLAVLGDLEAGLDFVDEDIEFITADQICTRLQTCRDQLETLASDSAARLPSGRRLRIVLAGLPNAGKSTLMNRLLGQERAIVSPVAGTTRDYLTAPITFGSIAAELIDTAGWEDANDLIMQAAQSGRSRQMKSCDLVLWCTAADLNGPDRRRSDSCRLQLSEMSVPVLDVTTCCDRKSGADERPEHASGESGTDRQTVSAATGQGLQQLIGKIEQRLTVDRSSRTELLSSTAARCRDSLHRALASLDNAMTSASRQLGDEITAMELRETLYEISTILGEVYTDDILDHIFSHFCIGK
ncbi:MAG: tRNA modification GTPase [Planctomycetaceae bacterium]